MKVRLLCSKGVVQVGMAGKWDGIVSSVIHEARKRLLFISVIKE